MAKILVTRPQPQAQDTADWLMRAGHHPIISPVIQLSKTDGAADDIADANRNDALIVTSQKALALLAEHHMRRDMPLLLTGKALAAKAERHGFTAVRYANNNAHSLLEMIQSDDTLRTQRLCYMHGHPIALDMVGLLSRAGFDIEGRCIYQSLPEPCLTNEAIDALQGDDVDCMLCYSLASAQSLLSLAKKHAVDIADIAICTISESITTCLQERGCRQVLTASSPAPQNILQVLDTIEKSG